MYKTSCASVSFPSASVDYLKRGANGAETQTLLWLGIWKMGMAWLCHKWASSLSTYGCPETALFAGDWLGLPRTNTFAHEVLLTNNRERGHVRSCHKWGESNPQAHLPSQPTWWASAGNSFAVNSHRASLIDFYPFPPIPEGVSEYKREEGCLGIMSNQGQITMTPLTREH